MSASNWAICPRCKAREEARIVELQKRADKAYGKVPVDEFDALRRAAETPIDEDALATFREDYEIYGAEDGQLIVSYGGGCENCGLKHSFRHDATFYDPERDGL